MSKTGLFFGPEEGAVHRIAKKIEELAGPENIDMIPVANARKEDLEKYQKIIFGISTVGRETWNQDFLNTDWSGFFPEFDHVSFEGKTIAIFGLGDHVTYPSHFVDAMGQLVRAIRKNSPGTKIVGQTSTEGYEFVDSEAVVDGRFTGLPLDEDFEPELTSQRVSDWVKMISPDFGF